MTMNPATLRDRLRGIVAPNRHGAPDRDAAPASSEAAPPSARHEPGALAQALGGDWRTHDEARSFVVTRRIAADARHGHTLVGDLAAALTAAQHGATLLSAGTAQAPFVFFDLETTGLSGGAGTHAFLVGCGWFDEAGAFVTEQHLLTDFTRERGMLAMVARDLARAGALVSFNGKSFDAPVIETRYLFHRLASPCAAIPHVDVLHPARRFWGGSAGCSLVALEEQLLGTRRAGDVPGFEIPGRYFQFIRTGDPQPLAGVLEHNRLDLLSLAAVTARLLTLVSTGPRGTADPREALALGRVYERADLDERAEEAYERVLSLVPAAGVRTSTPRGASPDLAWTPEGLRIDALRSLARSARRDRRFDAAASRWRELLDAPRCPPHVAREATEALAIHHEHRVRDLAAAKMFALRSLETSPEATWGDAVRHRLARIERKMVSERRPLFPSLPLLPSCGSPTSERRTSS